MRLRSERIVTPGGTIAGEVRIADGRIAGVESPGRGRLAPDAGEVIDLGAHWLVPGLVDLHVHGGGGAQCNTADADEVLAVAAFHAAHGTTALLATTVAADPRELAASLRAIRSAIELGGPVRGGGTAGGTGGSGGPGRRTEAGGGAKVLGAHLEGPFLSPERPGAMDPAAFREPDQPLTTQLLDTGKRVARMMTLAPELPGGLELVRLLADRGVVASIGHSDATYAQTRAAVAAGARAATHVFNAMRPFHHREPGVLGAVLDLPEVSCELICDGVHADPAAVRLVHRAKGTSGVRLATDAMQAAGMPDGDYLLGSARVEVREGLATIAGGGSIAGSTLTMDRALSGAVKFLGIAVHDAVALASTNPARLLGLQNRKGTIAPGMDADLTVLDDRLRARGTLVAGNWVHGPPVA